MVSRHSARNTAGGALPPTWAGFTRILMVTGDRSALCRTSLGAAVGLDGVLADRTPEDKVDADPGQEQADGARSRW